MSTRSSLMYIQVALMYIQVTLMYIQVTLMSTHTSFNVYVGRLYAYTNRRNVSADRF